jgi:signal transduction histidine kinase
MPQDSLAGHSVLIIDDDPANLGLLAEYLSDYDLEVLTAINGRDGLEAAQLAQPSLILLDVVMPEMDGFEVCRRLQADPATRDIPVIFITSLSEPEEKVKGFRLGAVDYITKPVYQAEALARIKTHLEIRRLAQSLQEQNRQLHELAERNAQLYRQVTGFNEELERLVRQRTEELTEAYQILEKMNEAQSNFIQVAAHELRTPLALIEGYTGLMQEDCDAQYHPLLNGILDGEHRLLAIVENLLDVSNIRGQVMDVRPEPVHLSEILNETRAEFETAFRERRLELRLTGLDSLPPILADPRLMLKLFHHLLVNAIKYTPDGGSIAVSGQVVAEVANELWVKLSVHDTGIGIDPIHHRAIFEEFFQVEPANFHSSGRTKFKGGGPGLGLAIAYGIVEAHGGYIWVESQGHDEQLCPGSTFYIMLPVSGARR